MDPNERPPVVCCGPESSGTRWLHRIVARYIGVPAIHRSVPHGNEGRDHDGWWDPNEFPGSRFVVIIRRPDVTTLSALSHHHARTAAEHRLEWRRAIAMLAAIPGAYWINYEALYAATKVQADNLAAWLGAVPTGRLPRAEDQNARWLSHLEGTHA